MNPGIEMEECEVVPEYIKNVKSLEDFTFSSGSFVVDTRNEVDFITLMRERPDEEIPISYYAYDHERQSWTEYQFDDRNTLLKEEEAKRKAAAQASDGDKSKKQRVGAASTGAGILVTFRGGKKGSSDGLTLEGFDNEMVASMYDGLNLGSLRTKVAMKVIAGDDLKEVSIRVMFVLGAYSRVGNNIKKLDYNRVDVDGTEMMKDSYEYFQMVETVGDRSSDITLPRMALMFLPAYLLLRYVYRDTLQPHTDHCNVVLQDLVFVGSKVGEMKGYKDFHKAFSKSIVNSGRASYDEEGKKTVKKNEGVHKEFNEKDYEAWMKVSANGYRNDKSVHNLMKTAVDWLINKPNKITTKIVQEMVVAIIDQYMPQAKEKYDQINDI